MGLAVSHPEGSRTLTCFTTLLLFLFLVVDCTRHHRRVRLWKQIHSVLFDIEVKPFGAEFQFFGMNIVMIRTTRKHFRPDRGS